LDKEVEVKAVGEPRVDEPMETNEPNNVLSAWMPKDALWDKKELAVKFLNIIPDQWTYDGNGMNTGNIMSWANEWSLRGGGTIPKFTHVKEPNAPSDIHITFIGRYIISRDI
jgi:hypothetical protein